MKWYLVALMSGLLTNSTPHANGHSMHAWEMGNDDPGRLVCLVHVQAYTRHKFPALESRIPGEFKLPPRLQEMVEAEIIKTVVCLDDETVKWSANSRLGPDTLEVRPLSELQRPLPKLPSPPPEKSRTPMFSPAPMPKLGGVEGEGGPREPIPTTPFVTVPLRLP
jgi:hypothetical protein